MGFRMCAPILGVLIVVSLAVIAGTGSPKGASALGVDVIVTTNADIISSADQKCSLREAIIATNNNSKVNECDARASTPGATDGIHFDIGMGTPVINVTSPLPPITAPLRMDGSGPATRVELHGPYSGTPVSGHDGLDITGSYVTIKNMVIDNFEDDGIKFSGFNLDLTGSYIGTNGDGTAASGNAGFGVQITGPQATIGGATDGGACSGDCNLISGNLKAGVFFDSGGSFGFLRGSFIGTDASGTAPLGNSLYGVDVARPGFQLGVGLATTAGGPCTGGCNLIATNDTAGTVYPNVEFESTATDGLVVGNFVGLNVTGTAHLSNGRNLQQGIEDHGSGLTIGGSDPTLRNVISGESAGEIVIYGNDAKVKGNYVGLNSAGTAAIPMSGTGMYAFNVTGTVIGGATPSEGNVISGGGAPGGHGIGLNSVTGAVIERNLIGTAADGVTPVPNGIAGVSVAGTSHDDIIGGAGPNTIMFNAKGVTVEGIPTPDKIKIVGNSIDDNTGKGIELGNGGNDNQAAPVIQSVQNDTNTTTHVVLSLTSAPNTDYQVDLYDSPVCDSSGYGEGRTHGATETVHTDGSGVGHLDTEEAQLGSVGTGVAATATDPNGDTSEFSNCLDIQGQATARIEGDVNCDTHVNVGDFEFLIEYAAGLNDGSQPAPCPDLGQAVTAVADTHVWGDVNCDGSVNAIDALLVLAHTVQIELSYGDCPPIGSPLT